jgi:hypothetical protein
MFGKDLNQDLKYHLYSKVIRGSCKEKWCGLEDLSFYVSIIQNREANHFFGGIDIYSGMVKAEFDSAVWLLLICSLWVSYNYLLIKTNLVNPIIQINNFMEHKGGQSKRVKKL